MSPRNTTTGGVLEAMVVPALVRGGYEVKKQVNLAHGWTHADDTLPPRLAPRGGLWLCWPKKASGVLTDIGEMDIHQAGLATGLVDNKVCAIDEVWSAFRFVHRRTPK